MSIYMFGLVLLGVSSFQYFNNTALRKFTQKTIQNKIIPIMSFRDATILRFSRERFIKNFGIGIELDKPIIMIIIIHQHY